MAIPRTPSAFVDVSFFNQALEMRELARSDQLLQELALQPIHSDENDSAWLVFTAPEAHQQDQGPAEETNVRGGEERSIFACWWPPESPSRSTRCRPTSTTRVRRRVFTKEDWSGRGV